MLPSIQFILGWHPGILLLPGIPLLFPVPSKNEKSIEDNFTCWKNKPWPWFNILPYFASLTNFSVWGSRNDRAFLPQSFSHRSSALSTDAGLNQSPLWDNPTFPFAAMVAEGQVNEEYLLRKNTNLMHEDPWLLMLQCDGLRESCGYHESRCLLRLGVRRRETTSTLCHAGPDVLPVLPIAGAFLQQSFSHQSTVPKRVQMQVSTSDHCETTILVTVPTVAKGQINEQYVLHKVDIWISWSWVDASENHQQSCENHVACSVLS